MLGADVFGYSLAPCETSLYSGAFPDVSANGVFADIRDLDRLTLEMKRFEPEIVFHFAAQAIVRRSYKVPVLTLETNIMGTVNLLEVVRSAGSVKSVLVVTSDKCYKEKKGGRGYKETDELGGADPYSSSKACVELICDAWRNSFFKNGVLLATARAGNVIGGGDWAEDRLVPDVMRAFQGGASVRIRMPNAIRPWQHVVEPLTGYMLLAEKLFEGDPSFADAFNFGPDPESAVRVEEVVDGLCSLWGGGACYEICDDAILRESMTLRLDPRSAAERLGWNSKLSFKETLELTVEWYYRAFGGENPLSLAQEQIEKYMRRLDLRDH
jgi:CDP-glucose 4,6-dehydratase